jgi:hypothetical protein
MRGVTHQKQLAVLHRLADETAQRRNALFDRPPGLESCRQFHRDARSQLVPKPIVGPLFNLILERTLNVITAAYLGTHAAQRKPALVVGVDQLLRHRRFVDQHAQPAERIDSLVVGPLVDRNRLARDAVKAVTPGDEVATDLPPLAVAEERNTRVLSLQVRELDFIDRIVDDRARRQMSIRQILLHLGLTVNGHRLARQRLDVDAVHAPGESQIEASMRQAIAQQAGIDAGFVQQIHRALFEHAGANARLDIFPAAQLQHHGADPRAFQQSCQQQPGGTGPDDDYLRSVQGSSPHLMRDPTMAQRPAERNGRGGAKLVLF